MRTRSLIDRRVILRYVHARKSSSVLHSLNSFLFSDVIYKMRLRKKSMLKTDNKITKIEIDGMNTRRNPVNPNKYCVGYGLSLNLWLEELD